MFGYIRPFKPELKMRDYELYRAVYCGLCHTLGKRYGFPARLTVSYDLTFLAFLQLGLGDACHGFEKRRCPVRPDRKFSCVMACGELDAAADLSVLLTCVRVRDNLGDRIIRKKVGALALMPAATWLHHASAKKNPRAEAIVCDYIRDQQAAESRNAGIDEAAHPTARMLESIFTLTLEGSADSRILSRMGYFLGRWVYFADACDDLEKDVRSGDFNPFVAAYGLTNKSDFPQARAKILMLMNSCTYEIAAACALLAFRRFRPVIENIVAMGLPEVSKTVAAHQKLLPV